MITQTYDFLKNTINRTISRWTSLWGVLIFLLLVWISFGIYEHWTKSNAQIAFIVTKELIELGIFYIGIKIVLGLNSVIDSIGESFKHIFLKREFFSTLSRSEMLNIAKDINKQDFTITFQDEKENNDALLHTKKIWSKKKEENSKEETTNSKNYIIQESWSTETLYSNEQIIIHRKFKVEMMEKGSFKATHNYMPFDEDVKEEIENEQYNKNIPGNRLDGKAFQYHQIGDNKIGEIKLNVDTVKSKGDDRRWISFTFETEVLDKGQTFIFEFAISDKIDTTNTKRCDSYFSNGVKKDEHAIRHLSFQIETYGDIEHPKIRLEPRIYKNGQVVQNLGDCCESLFYKKWNWTFKNTEESHKKISYKLIKPRRNLSRCI